MSGKRKLDRGQPQLRPGNLEWEAGGDLAAPQYHILLPTFRFGSNNIIIKDNTQMNRDPSRVMAHTGQPSSSIGVAFLELRRHLSGGLYHREQGPQQGNGPQGDALPKAYVLDDGDHLSGQGGVGERRQPGGRHDGGDYLLFNMLVLVGCIKMSDRLIRELMGLG